MDGSDNNVTFTASDTKLLIAMISHLSSPKIDTDWDKVAATAGYKDAASAQARFRKIRSQKLKISGDAASSKPQSKSAAEPQAKLDQSGKSGKGSSSAGSKRKRIGSDTTTANDEERVSKSTKHKPIVKTEDPDPDDTMA